MRKHTPVDTVGRNLEYWIVHHLPNLRLSLFADIHLRLHHCTAYTSCWTLWFDGPVNFYIWYKTAVLILSSGPFHTIFRFLDQRKGRALSHAEQKTVKHRSHSVCRRCNGPKKSAPPPSLATRQWHRFWQEPWIGSWNRCTRAHTTV